MKNTWEIVVDFLLGNMQKQIYRKDEKLPSEHELADKFQMTRIDIRKAYERLKELGYVYSQQGKGNYYAGYLEKVELQLSNDSSFTKKMMPLKERFYSRLLSCKLVSYDKELYHKMDALKDEKIYCIKRLRYIDHMPSAMHISYVKKKLFPTIEHEVTDGFSLFSYFQNKGYHNYDYEESKFTISTLNTEERLYMGVSGIVPCLVLKSKNVIRETKEVLEYSIIIYRGDKFTFTL